MVYQALLKRGASFSRPAGVLPENPSRNPKAFPFGKGACICGQLCAGKAKACRDKTRKATARQAREYAGTARQCRAAGCGEASGKEKKNRKRCLTEALFCAEKRRRPGMCPGRMRFWYLRIQEYTGQVRERIFCGRLVRCAVYP